MKKIILMVVMFSITLLPQSKSNFWKYAGYYSSGISYNGVELITNAVNRTFEPIPIYTSDFSAGVDGWINIWGTISGNIDGIYGRDNVAKVLANASGAYSYKTVLGLTIGDRFAVSMDYFIPLASTCSSTNFNLGTSGQTYNGNAPAKNVWLSGKGSGVPNASQIRIHFVSAVNGDSLYFNNTSIHKVSNYLGSGNHLVDTSSTYKQTNSYSAKIVATAAGNGTTNTVTLASTNFTAVTNGLNYRFQIYVYTSTANATLTFKLGDIVLTNKVPTSGMSVLNFDFKATASTTGNILLYLDKAATVYLDEVSLKSGQ